MQQPSEPLSPGMLYQLEIYEAGTQNQKPVVPVSYDALEQRAKEIMKTEAFDYVAGGAGEGTSMFLNRQAFAKWRIVPRMLTNVSKRSIEIELFGRKYGSPIFLAPIGVLGIVHPEGELPVARAAHYFGIPQIVSNVSSVALEDIAKATPSEKWFQLYWGSNNDFTKSILQRAERAGYKAVVVTLDTRIFAWRQRDIQNAYLPFLYGEGMANYFSDPEFLSLVGDPLADRQQTLMHFAKCFSNAESTWNDISFLKACTKLPIIVKGILHPDDAVKAIDAGADGIIVSNHGGRQMDSCVAALEALPEIVAKVSGKLPVLFDSGIRTGADVFKALALGARAILLGRPYAYGLAIDGEAGVRTILGNLLADTELTIGLAGAKDWSCVNKDSMLGEE